MPERLNPGVYIQEIERGPKPIEGVSTSTAAFIGRTERGSTKPRLVSSYKEYQHWFGDVFGDEEFMPHAVHGFFENGGKRVYVCRIDDGAALPAELVIEPLAIRAVGPGRWGERIYVNVEPSITTNAGAPLRFRLRIAYYSTPPTKSPLDWFNDSSRGPLPAFHESFDNLEMDEQSPNYWYRQLRDSSALVEPVLTPGAPSNSITAPAFGQLTVFNAVGQGEPRKDLQGLAALDLDAYREVSLVYAPGATIELNSAIVSHCERARYRFAVIDSDKNVNAKAFEPRRLIGDTAYAALYYPWIAVSDPKTGARKEVPPGGHVVGVYARTDMERGVFKAPANEVLRGVSEVLSHIDDNTQAILNPRGINAIRSFPGRGIRVWSARTLTSDSLWKYVNVRRLFIFLERSIYEGTQWVVFEPNDERLWARVVDTIRLFLRTQWRLGALLGRTEDEAFFITCDRSTMTQDDILNGRLICEIGIAAVRPAEFVIFRIFQTTAQPS